MKYLDETGLARVWGKIKTLLNNKQDTLVSGTNLKTINNQSLLGSGNINIQGGGGSTDWADITNKPTRFEPTVESFVIETYSEHSSKSVGTGGANTSYNISKVGYKPVGIVGFYIGHSNVLCRACYLTNIYVDDDDGTPVGGATINYYMRSVSGTNTATQTTRVLWVKI